MNAKTLLGVALVAVFAAGMANGQTKPKLYRWVDKQGKVHYLDALPPEAVNDARKEFNAKTGSTTASVERALTAEERAQQAAAAAAAEAEALKAGEQKHQEEIMMASYRTEADLRRTYDERINLLRTTLESTDISIKSLRENLAVMLSQASDTELEGRKVTDDRVRSIRELHAEKDKQQTFQVNRRVELEALTAEFARMLNRYRELEAAAATDAASAAPVVPPAPSGTP